MKKSHHIKMGSAIAVGGGGGKDTKRGKRVERSASALDFPYPGRHWPPSINPALLSILCVCIYI